MLAVLLILVLPRVWRPSCVLLRPSITTIFLSPCLLLFSSLGSHFLSHQALCHVSDPISGCENRPTRRKRIDCNQLPPYPACLCDASPPHSRDKNPVHKHSAMIRSMIKKRETREANTHWDSWESIGRLVAPSFPCSACFRPDVTDVCLITRLASSVSAS